MRIEPEYLSPFQHEFELANAANNTDGPIRPRVDLQLFDEVSKKIGLLKVISGHIYHHNH